MLRVSDVPIVSTANQLFLEPFLYSKRPQSAVLYGRQSAGKIVARFPQRLGDA